MKRLFFVLLTVVFLISCSRSNAPDVSAISVKLDVLRFEKDLFSIDTMNIPGSVQQLGAKYNGFLPDYFNFILAVPFDSVVHGNVNAERLVRTFLRDYRFVKDSSDRIFKNFSSEEKQIQKGLQYVKYYFPEYELPSHIITFIAPFDAFFSTSFGFQGDVITQAGLGIGLQLHLGSSFSFFKSEAGQDLYPDYISRVFEPAYIPLNCMHNIIDELYPPENSPRALIEQMVNAGKRYYLLTKFLPEEQDSMILGYTREQMEGAYKNEAVIWDFFLKSDLLNVSDQNMIKGYIGPGPSTQEFGEGSPGNIGSFSGLQIVRRYMNKFPETTLKELINIPAREVYERSKYKPRL